MSAEAELLAGRRLWALFMVSTSIEAFESIAAGRPVMAATLDAEALRRGLRGSRLPDPDAFLAVTTELLDAISEAGPIPTRRNTR